jgi:hypothetical protein
MARPNWEYIRVDVLLPEHPKLDGMSAAAKWTLIEMWCYCGRQRTDGIITAARWRTFGTVSHRKTIVERGLADALMGGEGGYLIHDFVGPDGHQRSRDEIDELAERRKDIATKAANARWGKEKPPLGGPQRQCPEHMHRACMKHASSMLRAYA